MKTRCAAMMAASSVMLALAASESFAADAASSETGDTGKIETVVVTATRRAADVQQVPVSMQVLSGGDITSAHITKLEDLLSRVPGTYFAKFASVNQYPSVRASQSAGYNASPGVAEGASLLIDDVVTTGIADVVPDFFDLDRVEVLKGPQGTLFGRNSTGGDIAIYTQKPSFTPEAEIQASYGSHNLMEAKGFVTGPITDDLAGRITISSHVRSAIVENADPITLKDDSGAENWHSVRGQLLYTPTEDFNIRLIGDYLHDDSDGKVGYLLGNYQPSLFPTLYYGFGKTNQAVPGFTHRDIAGLSAQANWSLGWGVITSITAYRHVNVADRQDEVADPLDDFPLTEFERDRQFTQELRLASSGNNTIDYTVGAFFLHAHKFKENDHIYNLQPGLLLTALGASTTPFFSAVWQDININSYAVFGEATWHIWNGLAFTAGIRETADETSGTSYHSLASIYAGPPISATYSKSWSAATPKFSLSYQITPDIMTYALASRGYKSGGFDSNPTNVLGLSTPFDPETVWNYEGGVKSEWFDHRFRLNATVYDMEYKNLQTQQFNPTTLLRQVVNAGNLDLKGVELELEGRPTDWLTLGGNYSYMHGKITHLPTFTSRIPAQTPKDSWYFYGDAVFPNAMFDSTLTLHADWSWRDRVFFDYSDSELPFVYNRTNQRGLLDLNATLTSQDNRWEFEVWGKNVTNVRYMSLGADVAAIYATTTEYSTAPAKHIWVGASNDPPTYGVTITYHWE